MRLWSTGSAKYRMRVLSAINLAGLPKPTIALADGAFGISWSHNRRLVTIVQMADRPSYFVCQTFNRLKPISKSEIDLETLEGPLAFLEFLNVVESWLT